MSQSSKNAQFEFSTKIRVRYAETDQMGFCYYGNYASFFEVARVEALRERGVSYKELEEAGILLPVKKFEIAYHLPARYDDLLEVKTQITQLEGVRIGFSYQTFNEAGHLLNEAFTQLVFVNAATQKPMAIPSDIYERLNQPA
ncbi:MAG: acyl-CoA thioesterase [Flavobacteriales bacterium]